MGPKVEVKKATERWWNPVSIPTKRQGVVTKKGKVVARASTKSPLASQLPHAQYMEVKHGVFHGDTPVFVDSGEETSPEETQEPERAEVLPGASPVKKKDNALIYGQTEKADTKSKPGHFGRRSSTVAPTRQTTVISKAPKTAEPTTKAASQTFFSRKGHEARGRTVASSTISPKTAQPSSKSFVNENPEETVSHYHHLHHLHGSQHDLVTARSETSSKAPHSKKPSRRGSRFHNSEITTEVLVARQRSGHSKSPEARGRSLAKTRTEEPLMIFSPTFSNQYPAYNNYDQSPAPKVHSGAPSSPPPSSGNHLLFRVPTSSSSHNYVGVFGNQLNSKEKVEPASTNIHHKVHTRAPTSKKPFRTHAPDTTSKPQVPKETWSNKEEEQAVFRENPTVSQHTKRRHKEKSEKSHSKHSDHESMKIPFFQKLSVTQLNSKENDTPKSSTQLPEQFPLSNSEYPTKVKQTSTTTAPKPKKHSKRPSSTTRKPEQIESEEDYSV